MKSLPKLIRVCPQLNSFRPIKGFESTDYAYSGDRIVWIGDDAEVRHPRNYWKPWQAPSKTYSAELLQAGAKLCLQQLEKDDEGALQGLLLWLTNRELPFPLNNAVQRFDAVRDALQAKQSKAFEAAALRVLGLGNGLTPSGDDFLGGILFALVHKPYSKWLASMPTLEANIDKACGASTNPISAALLANHISGKSFGELHDMLDALESNDSRFISTSRDALLGVGSSSGADMLAGLLLALTTI
jgi:hypothetical protein